MKYTQYKLVNEAYEKMLNLEDNKAYKVAKKDPIIDKIPVKSWKEIEKVTGISEDSFKNNPGSEKEPVEIFKDFPVDVINHLKKYKKNKKDFINTAITGINNFCKANKINFQQTGSAKKGATPPVAFPQNIDEHKLLLSAIIYYTQNSWKRAAKDIKHSVKSGIKTAVDKTKKFFGGQKF